ncbi:MAG: 3D domain-containing protein [Bacillota bacterium]
MKIDRKTPFIPVVRPVWIVTCLAVLVLAAGVVFGFTWAGKTVTLVDDEKETIIKTRAASVGEFLEEQKVQLGPKDIVTPDVSEELNDQSRVVIKRAKKIVLVVDNEQTEFYSTGETVGDVLGEKGVVLNGEDIVSPGIEEKITGDTEIRVIRVRTETEEVTASVPYITRREYNSEMSRGISRTLSRGRNGEEIQTWKVVYNDNQEVSRVLIEKKTVSKPVDEVVQVGTGQEVSRGGQVIRFREAMEVVATAYTYTGNNTCNGTKPGYGTVAVDPGVIPFGTRMYIEGYGYGTALDRGSAIKGKRIDLFLESSSEARRWGVRKVKVYILD